MGIKSADASLFQTAVLSAAKNLEAKKEWINELNVSLSRLQRRSSLMN